MAKEIDLNDLPPEMRKVVLEARDKIEQASKACEEREAEIFETIKRHHGPKVLVAVEASTRMLQTILQMVSPIRTFIPGGFSECLIEELKRMYARTSATLLNVACADSAESDKVVKLLLALSKLESEKQQDRSKAATGTIEAFMKASGKPSPDND